VFNIGGGEVLVILIVALIFLGPKKLPEIARALGKTTQTIRRVSDSFRSELDAAVVDGVEAQARQRGNEFGGDTATDMKEPPASHDDQKLDTETTQCTPVKDDEIS